jgi:hypothetical protein
VKLLPCHFLFGLHQNLQNQFVKKLGPFGLDPFRMLVIDFMHECELGTWKALFTHLIRLLYALPRGSELVAALDSRYEGFDGVLFPTHTLTTLGRFRQVPTFGNGVIRKFSNNTSEMKRLAARDFEDILQVFGAICFCVPALTALHCQCAIPVFEGLFPPDHDAMAQSLLYQFAQWHALAKLRIHSESTLDFLGETFKKLSRKLRKFRAFTCAAFDTLELPREKAARQRRAAERAETNGPPPDSKSWITLRS